MQSTSRVRILTDTTAVLPPGYAEEHHLEVIPQVIIFGNESLLENKEISYADFLERLKAAKELPKTAAPPVWAAEKSLQVYLEEADTVVCIHPSAELSGTIRTVSTAKEQSFPDADIRIIDTRTVGGNLCTMVQNAVRWAEAGQSADEIEAGIRAMIPREHSYFLVDTLDYLYRGGRIGNASFLMGSALSIKPILYLNDGRADVLEKVRTRRHAFERLIELVLEECPDPHEGQLCIMQADCLERARTLQEIVRQRFDGYQAAIVTLGAAFTVHAGPGTLAIGFFDQT